MEGIENMGFGADILLRNSQSFSLLEPAPGAGGLTFEQPDHHEPTPEGMSPRPIHQFLAEVEQILVENNLI
jgi:hypothetical protein